MKKAAVLALTAIVAVALSACGDAAPEGTPDVTQVVEGTVEAVPEPDQPADSVSTASVVWDGDTLSTARIACPTVSQFDVFTTLSDDGDVEFSVTIEDGSLDRIELLIGEQVYYAWTGDIPGGIDFEVGVAASGTVTLFADNDAARDVLPDGGDVEFAITC